MLLPAEARWRAREALLAAKEEAAKERLQREKQQLAERVRRSEADAADAAAAHAASVHRTFRRAEEALRDALARQKATVVQQYGRLVQGRAGARLLRVEWNKAPQPVEVRVSRVCAVKNKLPAGRYVLLCTLYDRLGGNPLRWTRLGQRTGECDACAAMLHRYARCS